MVKTLCFPLMLLAIFCGIQGTGDPKKDATSQLKALDASQLEALERIGSLVEEIKKASGDINVKGTVLPWREIPLPVSGKLVFLRRVGGTLEAHVQREGEHVVCTLDGKVVARLKDGQSYKPPADGFAARRIVWSASKILDYTEPPGRVLYEAGKFRMRYLMDIGEGAVAVAEDDSGLSLLRFDSGFGLRKAMRLEAKLGKGPGNDALHYPRLREIHLISSAGFLYRYSYDGKLIRRIDAPGGAGPNHAHFHSRMDSLDRFFLGSAADERMHVYEAKSGKELRGYSYSITGFTVGDTVKHYIQFAADPSWLYYTGNDSGLNYGAPSTLGKHAWWSARIARLAMGYGQLVPPVIYRDLVLFPAGHSLFLNNRETGEFLFRLACSDVPEEKDAVFPSFDFYSRHLQAKDRFRADSLLFDKDTVYAVGGPKSLYPSVYCWKIPRAKPD
jgi:hypothetical protein